jgi:hypothetical protein
MLGSFARPPWGAQNKIKGLYSSYFFSTELFFTLSALFPLYLARRSDVLLFRQPQRVGGGLQLREQLCIRGKKLVSFTDRIMKRGCSLARSFPLYLRPSPLAGCLVAWLAGEREQSSKQKGGRAGKQQLLGSFARPPWGAQNKIKDLSSVIFFKTSFFLHFRPFFSLFSMQE